MEAECRKCVNFTIEDMPKRMCYDHLCNLRDPPCPLRKWRVARIRTASGTIPSIPMRPSRQAPPPVLCFLTLPLTTYRISHARHTHTLPRLRLRLILIRFRSAPPAVGGVASNYHRAFPNDYSSLSKHELIWSPTPQSQRQKVDTPSLGSVICALLRVRSVGCPA